jgi:hypothetical protein
MYEHTPAGKMNVGEMERPEQDRTTQKLAYIVVLLLLLLLMMIILMMKTK